MVRALAKRGYRIRVAVRRPDLAGHLQPLGRVGPDPCRAGECALSGSVEAAVRGADVVINLVGILFERGRQRFEACSRPGAELVALAAAAAGARMIHVSALGADENSPALYARTKAAGRKGRARRARRTRSIFRPSIVFGPEDDFFNRFAAHGADVAGAAAGRRRRRPSSSRCSSATSRRRSPARSTARPRPGAIYELGGPEVRTFRELMEYVLAITERRRLLVPLPFAAGASSRPGSCSSCRSRC